MKRAFTLIELMTVLAVIAVLMAMLLPALRGAREQARTAQCLSNLRQLASLAQLYATEHGGRFPLSYWDDDAWDFGREGGRVVPGFLWRGRGETRVQQCPSFEGSATWGDDPHTGYNYNTSFIGAGEWETRTTPARLQMVKQPSATALFGDGQWSGGANKFMRAPLPAPEDRTIDLRLGGTQGFRHRGATNVAFVDGHAVTWTQRHRNTIGALIPRLAPGTGFLSHDNEVYDLR